MRALLAVSSLNVNAQNVNGQTALIQAARSGDREIIEMLLARGADVRLASSDGTTALTALPLTMEGFAAVDSLLRTHIPSPVEDVLSLDRPSEDSAGDHFLV